MAETTDPPAATANVIVAFQLGWHVAELYSRDIARQTPPEPSTPPDVLPGLSLLSSHERDTIIAGQISAGLHLLKPAIESTGTAVPSADDLTTCLNDLHSPKAAVKLAIRKCHKEILEQLWTADTSLGKAYGLGRALADTTLKPKAGDSESFKRYFDSARIDQLSQWLGELGTSFPDLSGRAVQSSVKRWERWVRECRASSPEGAGAINQEAIRCLRLQGRLWRALLTGEKRAEDLLEPKDYVTAAERTVSDAAELVWIYVKRWKYIILVSVLVAVAIIAGLSWALGGRAQTVAVATALLAAAGLSWKGIGATLGSTLKRVEMPVWRAEVANAAAVAAEVIPPATAPPDPASRDKDV